MQIGEKDVDVTALVKLNAAGIPLNAIIAGESAAGFALADLAALQSRMASGAGRSGPRIPLDRLPDVALRNAAFKVAQRPAPDEGVEQGFTLRGDLVLPPRPGAKGEPFAQVDVEVGEGGLFATGRLGERRLGPLLWEDAVLDLAATPSEQHLVLRGAVEMLGERKQVDLSLSRESLAFPALLELAGRWESALRVTSEFDLERPRFRVEGELPPEFCAELTAQLEPAVGDLARQAAGWIQEAQDVAGKVRQAREATAAEIRSRGQELGASTRERAEQVVADAARRRDAAKQKQEAAHAAWQDVPASEPARKAALKAVYELAEENHAQAEQRWTRLRAVLADFDSLQAEAKRLDGELAAAQARSEETRAAWQGLVEAVRTHRGALVEVSSASFEAELEVLLGGKEVQLALQAEVLGEGVDLECAWSFPDPKDGIERVLDRLFPGRAEGVPAGDRKR